MYNPYNFSPYNNPYNNIFQPQQPQSNTLPQQQIIQVNGKASVDTIQLAPNSSILVMDTSAPIVWMCVSDGVGKVTSTPYDISVHKEEPPVDVKSIEQRLAAIEGTIAEMEGRLNVKSDVSKFKSKSNIPDGATD